MAQTNGYFQIVNNGGKNFVRLIPPVNGGEPILINEIREYLAFNNFTVDAVALNTALTGLSGPVDFPIADGNPRPVNEYFKLMLSDDKMKAIARFYPAQQGGQELGAAEIVNDLTHKGIRYGVSQELIGAYIKDKRYCTDIVVAEGLEPTRGKNASIEYFFNTDPNVKPALNPDGTVDFFNLNTISKCTKGMKLATLTPEVRGERGFRVTGEVIPPNEVKSARLQYGLNISLSEDELEIFSDVDGHVTLVDGKVFVSDVYEVVDVDTSTGNIDFQGNVLVTGSIKAGFCVEADGDIEVKGVVEGALVKAGGNIIIARGINGMNKGIISAGGNVVAKFIENATVHAGGYVHAEAIIHSSVTANGDVDVTGKKGFIVGGNVRALGCVNAVTIGSEMGGETEIEVGIDPKLKARAVALEEAIRAAKQNLEKIEPILATFAQKIKEKAPLTAEQINYFKQLSEQYKAIKANHDSLIKEYDEIAEDVENVTSESTVSVQKNIYPGTKLTISEVSQVITKEAQHSKFVRDGADLRIKPL